MSNIKELIINALHYYDSNRLKYDKIMSKAKYYSFITTKGDLENNTIIFYDKNKKEFFRSRFELVGEYIPSLSMWIWGWGLPIKSKNTTHISKKIFDYAFDLTPDENLSELKLELMTPRIPTNSIQLDIHLAIASYISKIKLIYKIVDKEPVYKGDLIKIENEEEEEDLNMDSESITFLYLYLLDYDNFKLGQDST